MVRILRSFTTQHAAVQGFLHCQGISPQLQNTWDTVRVTSGRKGQKVDHLDEKKNIGTIQHATTIQLLPSSGPWHGYGSPQRAAPSVHPLIHKLQCTRAFPPSARGQCHYVWSKASLGPTDAEGVQTTQHTHCYLHLISTCHRSQNSLAMKSLYVQ